MTNCYKCDEPATLDCECGSCDQSMCAKHAEFIETEPPSQYSQGDGINVTADCGDRIGEENYECKINRFEDYMDDLDWRACNTDEFAP